MQLSHSARRAAVLFDDPNLVSPSGLVPTLALAESAGLRDLADQWLTVPTDKGANAGLKVASLVAGMVAGADSIDDMALLRHGAMRRVFRHPYAPSTLGSFLRSFTFGHVRQLDAVASRFLARLTTRTPLLEVQPGPASYLLVDVDDTVIEVHGYAKQGSGYGYSRVHGLNALLATVSTTDSAPLIVAQRLRRGSSASARGAKQLVAEALTTVASLHRGPGRPPVLVRMDAAFYTRGAVSAALRAGADVSVTMKQNPMVRAAIAAIPEDAWQPIQYTDAVFDEATGRWISSAEVAEIPFTAFASTKDDQVPGRLVVRRVPELNPRPEQDTLFDPWRFHAFFTTVDQDILDTAAADRTHRRHAIIEQVNADLKNSALAHMPSGRFTANAAWLVLAVLAFNLTRAAGALAGGELARATTATVRRKLVHVPARIASSARRLTLHLPENWPWREAWTRLFTHACGPPPPTQT